jgi:hypothetical protein
MTKPLIRRRPTAAPRPRTTVPNIVQLIPGTTRLPIGPRPLGRTPTNA